MWNRDAVIAFFMYYLSGQIVPTSFSLFFDSWLVFWLGQIVVALFAFTCVGLTFGSKNRDKE
jgi:hypothetical protein